MICQQYYYKYKKHKSNLYVNYQNKMLLRKKTSLQDWCEKTSFVLQTLCRMWQSSLDKSEKETIIAIKLEY